MWISSTFFRFFHKLESGLVPLFFDPLQRAPRIAKLGRLCLVAVWQSPLPQLTDCVCTAQNNPRRQINIDIYTGSEFLLGSICIYIPVSELFSQKNAYRGEWIRGRPKNIFCRETLKNNTCLIALISREKNVGGNPSKPLNPPEKNIGWKHGRGFPRHFFPYFSSTPPTFFAFAFRFFRVLLLLFVFLLCLFCFSFLPRFLYFRFAHSALSF